MNLFAFSSLLILIVNSIIAIFVLRSGKGKKIDNIWSFFCLLIALWGFGSFKFSTTASEIDALFWRRIANISVILTPTIFYYFIITFLNLTKKYFRFIFFSSYLLAFYFLILNLLFSKEAFIGGARFVFKQFYYSNWLEFKSLNYLVFYISFYWLLLGYAFFLLIHSYRYAKGIFRNQLKYFILAAIIAWNGPILMWLIEFKIDIYPYSNFLLVIYPIIFAYAILRYRLMDLSIILTRSGIFIAVYSLVLGIPLILIYTLQNELASLLGVAWWIVPYFCSIILSTIGPFLYFYINERAEAKLMREQRTYQNVLKSASRGMIRIKDLNRLLNLIVHVVTKTVRIKHAFVYILDPNDQKYKLLACRGSDGASGVDKEIDLGSFLIRQLTNKREPMVTEEEIMRMRDDSNNIAIQSMVNQLVSLKASLLVPSFVEDRLLGILVLGEKRSGKLYSQDDINVFSVLANQAALAIENAQFYEEIKQTHEQLFQAEKMATIGTMADGLSHQINNRFHALSLIAGDSLDMLKTFDWSGCNEGTKQVMTDLKSALERIENNVLQGGEIVKGILKYSRPGDSGFESVDFKDVLNGAIEMVQYKIKLKEIDIVQNIPTDLPKLHGNLTQLQEVFFNLIDNAYDAIKERQMTLKEEGYRGKIEVTADRSSNSLEIRVTDNGIGVKDLDKKKLFTPFFTTKATAKKGTGLGLYVIEKIIASHNGKIDIESAYNSGTRFIIILPTTPSAT